MIDARRTPSSRAEIGLPSRKSLIYVVDDDYDVLRSLRFLLETEGFEVRTFRSGSALLGSSTRHSADCLVVDYKMAGMDGIAVTTALRAIPETQGMPVLMLTTKTDEPSTRAGFESGVTDYVTKPFSIPQLASRVRACLARAQRP